MQKSSEHPGPALPTHRQRAPQHPYHAVSIQPGISACAAAYGRSGQRVLSCDAPGLPLAGCDAQHCECQYRQYPDRRVGPRRRGEGSGAFWRGEERRWLPGRRATDVDAQAPGSIAGPGERANGLSLSVHESEAD